MLGAVEGMTFILYVIHKMKTWLNEEEIKEGQIWSSCDGSSHKVTIVKVNNGWVHYSWIERGNGELKNHKKTVFAFQVRYYLP